jgi:uncharacterized protein YggT (Ycf19 family)
MRRVLPLAFSGIDLTPIALLMFLFFIKQIILSGLYRLAHNLG